MLPRVHLPPWIRFRHPKHTPETGGGVFDRPGDPGPRSAPPGPASVRPTPWSHRPTRTCRHPWAHLPLLDPDPRLAPNARLASSAGPGAPGGPRKGFLALRRWSQSMPLPSLKFPLSVPLFTPTGIPPSGPQPEAPDFGFIWFVSVRFRCSSLSPRTGAPAGSLPPAPAPGGGGAFCACRTRDLKCPMAQQSGMSESYLLLGSGPMGDPPGFLTLSHRPCPAGTLPTEQFSRRRRRPSLRPTGEGPWSGRQGVLEPLWGFQA